MWAYCVDSATNLTVQAAGALSAGDGGLFRLVDGLSSGDFRKKVSELGRN